MLAGATENEVGLGAASALSAAAHLPKGLILAVACPADHVGRGSVGVECVEDPRCASRQRSVAHVPLCARAPAAGGMRRIRPISAQRWRGRAPMTHFKVAGWASRDSTAKRAPSTATSAASGVACARARIDWPNAMVLSPKSGRGVECEKATPALASTPADCAIAPTCVVPSKTKGCSPDTGLHSADDARQGSVEGRGVSFLGR